MKRGVLNILHGEYLTKRNEKEKQKHHLNVTQFYFLIEIPRGRCEEGLLMLLFILTTHTVLTKCTGFDYSGVLQLLRPPGLLHCDCWCKPDLDLVHQPLIVQTSDLKTQPGGRREPRCATDQISLQQHILYLLHCPGSAVLWPLHQSFKLRSV